MPETFSETREILDEIRRLRPDWLRTAPNRSEYMRLFHDWRSKNGGMWRRARDTPSREAMFIDRLGGARLQWARHEHREVRKEIHEKDLKPPRALGSAYSTPSVPLHGWKGDAVAAWRVHAFLSVTPALDDPEHPYTTWLNADVDVKAMLSDPAGWVSFWFYDVNLQAVPRCWLRWAFDFLQGFRKVTDGTPCDTQLATYLPEADVVLSSDGGSSTASVNAENMRRAPYLLQNGCPHKDLKTHMAYSSALNKSDLIQRRVRHCGVILPSVKGRQGCITHR
jgi:hypothetical protein